MLQAWYAGLSRLGHGGQLALKLQLPAVGRVTILALDLGDSVMINTCVLTSSCRLVGSKEQCKSDQPAPTLCEFHHILFVIPLCCIESFWTQGAIL